MKEQYLFTFPEKLKYSLWFINIHGAKNLGGWFECRLYWYKFLKALNLFAWQHFNGLILAIKPLF